MALHSLTISGICIYSLAYPLFRGPENSLLILKYTQVMILVYRLSEDYSKRGWKPEICLPGFQPPIISGRLGYVQGADQTDLILTLDIH